MYQIECYIPKWMETLPQDHEMKQAMIQILQEEMKNTSEENWTERIVSRLKSLPFVKTVVREEAGTEEDTILRFQIGVREEEYYGMLSELSGIPIEGEYQLISLIRELSGQKKEYESVRNALKNVRETGYGVILPGREEIQWEEPVMTHTGSRYGVKMKATSPTIHLIRAEIDTEISPIVGTEGQAEDLIRYIREGAEESEGIWEINVFGKTVEQLMQEGMQTKLNQFSEESQNKIRKVIGRVLDESKNGMICVII